MKKILLLCCLFSSLGTTAFAQLSLPTNSLSLAKDPVTLAKDLQKQLSLSDAVTKKVTGIYQGAEQKLAQIEKSTAGNPDKAKSEASSVQTSAINKIKALLNPTQLAKYEQLLKSGGGSILKGL
jgi:TPP-dependent 2-oxoacid decarboxylase